MTRISELHNSSLHLKTSVSRNANYAQYY